MTDMPEIQFSERPWPLMGAKIIETNRRQLQAAVSAIPKGREADELREVLSNLHGIGGADRIINDMARGLVFK